MKRHAGDRQEKPTTGGKTIALYLKYSGSGRPNPAADVLVSELQALGQEGLHAYTTDDPEKVRITYDTPDDLERVGDVLRAHRGAWRFA